MHKLLIVMGVREGGKKSTEKTNMKKGKTDGRKDGGRGRIEGRGRSATKVKICTTMARKGGQYVEVILAIYRTSRSGCGARKSNSGKRGGAWAKLPLGKKNLEKEKLLD